MIFAIFWAVVLVTFFAFATLPASHVKGSPLHIEHNASKRRSYRVCNRASGSDARYFKTLPRAFAYREKVHAKRSGAQWQRLP